MPAKPRSSSRGAPTYLATARGPEGSAPRPPASNGGTRRVFQPRPPRLGGGAGGVTRSWYTPEDPEAPSMNIWYVVPATTGSLILDPSSTTDPPGRVTKHLDVSLSQARSAVPGHDVRT